jgi:glycosyltransferase involved in cell wall biosynthesis
MKISLINTYDISGGAARAMYRLHQGLLAIGQDSKVLSINKNSTDDNVIAIDPTYAQKREGYPTHISSLIQDYISHNRSDLSNTLYSFPYPDFDLSNHPRIQESDIINLHWVAYFQSPRTIESLLATKKPIVWTLHDEWAFTGGCHYTAGCKGFTDKCSNCPQLTITNSQIPIYILKEKLDRLTNQITVISPTNWLANQAKLSKLFRDSRIEVIPNAIDTSIFQPTPKDIAKKNWDIEADTFTLLFGAENGNERRKGFAELLEALRILSRNPSWQSQVESGKIRILVFGQPSKDIKSLGIPYTSLGHTKDDLLLALAYSAADLFVLPSLEDNLPNTMLESLSCETPIVAFQAGGIPDVVIPGKTGWIAEYSNSSSLAYKILEAYENPNLRKTLGENGRKWMTEEFHMHVQAEKYIELFNELLAKHEQTETKYLSPSSTTDSYLPESIIDEVYSNSKDILFHGYSEYKRYQALENYSISRAQIFFAEDGTYDYTRGIQKMIPSSTVFTRFELSVSLTDVIDFGSNEPFECQNPTAIMILPSLRNSFEICIHQILVHLEDSQNHRIDLHEVHGNWTVKSDSSYLFYHGHGLIQFPLKYKGIVGVEIIGNWRIFHAWEAFEGLNHILGSRVNQISMKIGNALVKPLRWMFRKRSK